MTRNHDDAISKLDKAALRLEEANTKLAKKEDELETASAQFQDLSNSLKQTKDSMEKEVTKWKMLYESLYLQYDNELHAWEDSLTKLEKQRDEREVAFRYVKSFAKSIQFFYEFFGKNENIDDLI